MNTKPLVGDELQQYMNEQREIMNTKWANYEKQSGHKGGTSGDDSCLPFVVFMIILWGLIFLISNNASNRSGGSVDKCYQVEVGFDQHTETICP